MFGSVCVCVVLGNKPRPFYMLVKYPKNRYTPRSCRILDIPSESKKKERMV